MLGTSCDTQEAPPYLTLLPQKEGKKTFRTMLAVRRLEAEMQGVGVVASGRQLRAWYVPRRLWRPEDETPPEKLWGTSRWGVEPQPSVAESNLCEYQDSAKQETLCRALGGQQ